MIMTRIPKIGFLVALVAAGVWHGVPNRARIGTLFTASVEAATQNDETEMRLGPFSIGAKDYTVVTAWKPRSPGSTQEAGSTAVWMEIRAADQTAVYRRDFPVESEVSGFSDAWSVSVAVVTSNSHSGLMVNYVLDSEPSAPVPEPTSWWQLFGVVNGTLKPFSGPIAVTGDLLGTDSDLLEFKVWAHHFRLVFPVRVFWSEGRLSPERDCENRCEFKVLPEELGFREDLTFVRFCSDPNEPCPAPQRVLVRKDSQIALLSCRVRARWKQGTTSGPSAIDNNPSSDQGEISIPDSDLWLKVRIDGTEGWLHDEEDFMALGLPFDQ